jgi:hypothetical protein
LGGFVLFLLPTLFTALTYKGDWNAYASGTEGGVSGTYALIGQEIISVTFAMMLAAMALLFSARCRRSLMALGIVLVALFLGLVAFPMLLAILFQGSGMEDFVNVFHPFMAINRLEELRHFNSMSGYGGVDDYHLLGGIWYGFVQGFIYLLGTGLFLGWATKTVTYADGEKKFLPKKRNA